MSRAHSFTPIVILKFDGIINDKNRSLTFQIDEFGVYRIVERNEIWSRTPLVIDTVDLIFYQMEQLSEFSPFIEHAHIRVCGEIEKMMRNPDQKRELSFVIDVGAKSVNV